MDRAAILVILASSVGGIACAPTIHSYNPAEVCQPAERTGDASVLAIEDAEDGDNRAPLPPAIDPSALFGIQFQVRGRATRFDVWIDDLAFMQAALPALTPAPGT